jgi:hypothetical protein
MAWLPYVARLLAASFGSIIRLLSFGVILAQSVEDRGRNTDQHRTI